MQKQDLLKAVPFLQDPFQDPRPIPGFVEPKPLWGWHGTIPIFTQLIEMHQPEVIIEVGSWLGDSAITMAKSLKKVRPQDFEKAILCPAPWNDNYEIFWRGDDAVLEYLFTKLNEVFYGE